MKIKEDEIIKKLRYFSPLDLGFAILIAEEVAREMASKVNKNIPKTKEIKIMTRVLDLKDEVVNETFELINTENAGRLIELTIRSPTNNFNIMVFLDGKIIIDRSYDDLTLLSPSSEIIDAYIEADTKNYVLHMKNINWSKNFIVKIYTDGIVKINNIFAVWEEHVVS